jgi:hypothetical protein
MLLPILAAGVIAGVTAWLASAKWESALGHGNLATKLGAVFVPMTAAGLIYWGLTLWFKVPPALEIGHLVGQRLRLGRSGTKR